MKYLMVVVLMACSFSVMAWDRYQDINYQRGCENEISRVIIHLHGANISYRTKSSFDSVIGNAAWSKTFASWLDDCALIAIPESNIITHDSGKTWLDSWDFKDTYGNGDLDRLIDIVALARNFNAPIVVVGGSAGAFMAYALAVELHNLDLDWLSGLAMVDGISSFSVEYGNTFGTYSGADLGFSGDFNTSTFYVYSSNDPLLDEEYKRQFASDLGYVSMDLSVVRTGTNHRISDYGMYRLTNWVNGI